MNFSLKTFQITFFSILFIISTNFVYAEEKKTEQAQTDLGLTLNEGNKWETDESLRKGMLEIHQLLEKSQKSSSNQKPTAKESETLASQINKELIDVVNNCELAPKADASLHVIIGEMMKGVGELSKASETQNGFSRINNALKAYPKFFNHPNWSK